MSVSLILSGLALMAIVSAEARAEGSESSKFVIRPCPSKPNCVSSRAPEGPRKMNPIRYQGPIEEARQRILEIIRTHDRATVVQNDPNYVRVEFRSPIFSFIDEVEFEFDDASKLIHFRSAARVGYYDFGVNRRRMEAISFKFSSK